MRQSNPTIAALVAFAAAMLLVCNPLAAQDDKIVELTPAQEDKMAQGRAAYKDGDFEKAAGLYDEAIALGPFNLGYLNKGRSLQRAGKCDEAAEALRALLKAPVLAEPAPDTIRGAMSRYMEELSRTCQGTLTVECDPGDALLNFAQEDAGMLDAREDTEMPDIMCGKAVRLAPGRYTIEATAHDQRKLYEVEVKGVDEALVVVAISANPETQIVVKEITGGPDPMVVVGWSTLGFGALSVASGVTFSILLNQNNKEIDTLANQPVIQRNEIDDLRSNGDLFETLQFVGYAAGIAGIATGLTLLYLHEDASEEDPNSGATALSPWVGPDQVGAVWSITY